MYQRMSYVSVYELHVCIVYRVKHYVSVCMGYVSVYMLCNKNMCNVEITLMIMQIWNPENACHSQDYVLKPHNLRLRKVCTYSRINFVYTYIHTCK